VPTKLTIVSLFLSPKRIYNAVALLTWYHYIKTSANSA